MIKFYNTKMMSPEGPGSNPVTPGKGTYAHDKMVIEYAKSILPTDPFSSFVRRATKNVITYFESDHPVETEEPDAEKQIVYNHDYVLEVDPSEDTLVRESKELLDADIRAAVAQLFEESEGSIIEPTTDPVTPVPGQQD